MKVITGAIIQARMGASRLPNKVALDLNGKTVLEQVISRIKRCKLIDLIIVATTESGIDDKVVEIAQKSNTLFFRGSETDVLARYYYAARKYKLDNIVRITADCPMIDAEIVDQVIDEFFKQKSDYAANTLVPTYPDGLDCEVMTFQALEKSFFEAKLKYEREHVTQFIIQNPNVFKHASVTNEADLSKKRWTLDEPEDYDFVKTIYQGINKKYFTFHDILDFLKRNPEIEKLNERFQRNEGLAKSIREEKHNGQGSTTI